MKSFSNFINEAITASKRARMLGLKSDGHGGWYNPGTGEYEAKSDYRYPLDLKFFNKNHKTIIGRKDKRSKGREHDIASKNWVGNIGVREELSSEELREKYINKEIFNVGEYVKSLINENVGKIIRRGANHLICVTEDGTMFKSWIKDVTYNK